MNGALATIHRTFDALLRRRSIDPIAYRALVHSFLLMDLRNQQFGKSTATGPKARIAPLFWVLGQNLIVGLICSVVMFARVDVLFFTLVGLCASIVIVGSAVIVEFREIVLDPQDSGVLGHRPIPARTYAAARVTNLLGYLLVCSCSAGLFPAIVGAGLRDAGLWQFPAYVCGALIGDFLVAGLIILLFVCLRRESPSNVLQEGTAWLQVGLILILFYGGQVILRDGSQPLSWISYSLPPAVWYLPVTWLAGAVSSAGSGALGGLQSLLIGAAVTVAVWWTVLGFLAKHYEQLQPGRAAWVPQTSPPLVPAGELAGRFGRWVTLPGEERVAFWLTWVMLSRDPNLRMRCWPALAIVVALVSVGALTGQLENPLTSPFRQCVMTLAAVYLVGEAAPALLHQVRYSSQFEASWVLSTSPITDPSRFVRGICKALWWRFVVPVNLFTAIVFAWVWKDPLAITMHAILIGLAGWGFLYGCAVVQFRSIPFSYPLARGESFGPIAGLTAAMMAIAMAFAGLHGAVAQNRTWFICYFIGTIVLTAIVHFVADRVLRHRLQGGLT
jgi:hypothetical protein